MILPRPCDFSEEEKGASHSVRLVARVLRIGDPPFAPKQVARGQIHHVMWVGPHDWAVDLRTATPVDRAVLNVDRRVAALSGPAWMALMRRLVYFYTRMSIPCSSSPFKRLTSIRTTGIWPTSSTPATRCMHARAGPASHPIA
jgi:hypothetical protein